MQVVTQGRKLTRQSIGLSIDLGKILESIEHILRTDRFGHELDSK